MSDELTGLQSTSAHPVGGPTGIKPLGFEGYTTGVATGPTGATGATGQFMLTMKTILHQ